MKLPYAPILTALLFGFIGCSSDSNRGVQSLTDIPSVGSAVAKTPAAPGTPVTPNAPGVTPAAAPTPSVPSSSTGPGLSGVALVSDDFTGYATTADFESHVSANIGGTAGGLGMLYNDGRNAQLAEIDPSVRYNGHATLKYNAPGGTSSIPELWSTLPRPLSTMWFRVKIKFSPGFTTVGTLTNSSNAYKLLGWSYSDSYGSGRVEITNTTQYQLYYVTSTTGTNDATSTPPEFAIGGNVNTEWSDGNWYDYIIEYQNTSATTSVARLWIARDGSTPVLRATSTSTSLPGFVMSHIGSVSMGMNFNQIRAQNQSQALWYGQWEVVDGVQHPNPFGLAGNY